MGHFKAGYGNAARVYCLRGSNHYAVCLQVCNCLVGGGHIRNLNVVFQSVCNHLLGIVNVDLVLGSARHNNVNLFSPRLLTCEEGNTKLICVILYAVAAGCAHFKQVIDLFLSRNAVFIVNVAVGAGDGNNLAAQLVDLNNSTPSNVTKAGDRKGLTFDLFAVGLEHFCGVVNRAKAGSLGANEGTAVGATLTGQHAGEFVAQSLVLTKEVADLACANADVACGNVGIGADVLLQLGHKALAETHNLSVRLALGVKVRAALTAAHRQTCQGVLKGLLKAEELDNALVYRGMEAESSLVGTDRAIELNAEAAVDLNLAVVVYPRNAEFDNALRLNHHIDDAALNIDGALLHNGFERFENLANGLVELALAGVAGDNVSQNFLQIFILNAHDTIPPCWMLFASFVLRDCISKCTKVHNFAKSRLLCKYYNTEYAICQRLFCKK